jgi:hypothetical protein
MNRAMTIDQRAESTCRAGDGPAGAVWRHDDARALLAALPSAAVDPGRHISPNEAYLRAMRIGFRNLCVPRRFRTRTRVPGAVLAGGSPRRSA